MHQLRKNGTYRLIDPKTWRAGVYRPFKDTGIPKRVYEHPKRAEAEERMRREQEARRVKRVRETERNREMSAADYRRTQLNIQAAAKRIMVRAKRY